jgi:GDP-L-fucose synthase
MEMGMGDSIVVTGGNGFLGTAVVRRLRDCGYRNIHTFHSNLDLTKQHAARQMFFMYNPDVVIHLAARVGGIGANQRNPGKFAYDNLMMGANIIEEARQYKLRKLVIAGTICAYPKFTPVPFKEDDLFNGAPEETNAPYGLAKKMLLTLAQGYRAQYGLNSIYLLPVNLYGVGDNFDLEDSHVIPAMIRKFHDAKETGADVQMWGDGSATREFLYVDDCAQAFVAAMGKYDGAEPINIGSGVEISISALATTIQGVVGHKGRIVWDPSRPNGQPRRCLDTSRAERLLGWKASTTFEDGLRKTYAWHLESLAQRVSSHSASGGSTHV